MNLLNQRLCAVVVCVVVMAVVGCPQPVTAPSTPPGTTTPTTPATPSSEATMQIDKEPFGEVDGVQVDFYTLTNDNGLKVSIMTYGATITSVETPDREGKIGKITLFRDSLDDYLAGHPYFGSTIGRYGIRIAKGKFTLDGVEYTLAINNGENHLHGGPGGFDRVVWQAEEVQTDDAFGMLHIATDFADLQ